MAALKKPSLTLDGRQGVAILDWDAESMTFSDEGPDRRGGMGELV